MATPSMISEQRVIKLDSDLKSRLATSWRKVWRGIMKADEKRSGKILMIKFSEILHQNDVFVSREELLNLSRKYGSY